ncbi:hypothetical protein DL93DRAFT_1885939 [Clavulina sp. PMI_390]|nr:hypothetical protein DL93DRAFT_1885939 [Clavulina sp. PMI_390]
MHLSVSPIGCEYDDFADTLDTWNESLDEKDIQESLSQDDPTRPDLTIILSALQGLGLGNGLVPRGRKDGVFIVLLYLLPKLHVLNIEAEPSLRCIAYACFGAFGGKIPSSLQSIVTLEISGKGDPMTDGGFATEEVIPFMTLPSLKSFTVYDFSGVETPHLQIGALRSNVSSSFMTHDYRIPHPITFLKSSAAHTLLPNSCSLTNLIIRNSVMSCELLNQILTLPMHLETFELEFGDYSGEPELFCPSIFLPGLQNHSSSLRELVIIAESAIFDSGGHEQLIGSLSDMAALETLRVPLPILLTRTQEDQSSDADNNDDEVEGWHLRISEASARCNPIDELLPSNLKWVELDIAESSFTNFVRRTGIPHSLTSTRLHMPLLTNLTVKGYYYNTEVLQYFLERVPYLSPPIKLVLFKTYS